MSEHRNDSPGTQPTVFSQNCHIKGNISIDGDAVVLGTIEGNLESSGRVEVGPDGAVEGDVIAGSMHLDGRVTGDVQCDDELELSGHVDGNVAGGKVMMGSTATLVGSLRAKIVSVAEGAVYRGEVIIGPDALDDIPSNDKTAHADRHAARADSEARGEQADSPQDIDTAPARGAVSGLLRRRHELLTRSSNGSRT